MNKVAFLFPGGGTQYIGMGKALYDEHKIVREIFEEANDIMGYNLRKICFEGSLDKLSLMNNSLPAIFTTSFATYQVFKTEVGIKPAFACGHSLGEYTALTCAGALQFGDALQLIKKRGALLQQVGNTYDATMMAVSKVPSHVIEEECEKLVQKGGRVYISVYNSEKQHVISGARKNAAELAIQLEKRGADPVILNINTPSHCPLMNDVIEEFKAELKNFNYTLPLFPVISNVTGQPYTENDNIFEMLTDHLVKPVHWFGTMRYLENQGITHAIEIGPQAVLKNLVPFITDRIRPFSFDITDDVAEIRKVFKSTGDITSKIIQKCISIAVSTKNYNDNESQFEEEVVQPFQQFSQLRKAAQERPEPGIYESEAIRLLAKILEAKKTPAEDRSRYMASLSAL